MHIKYRFSKLSLLLFCLTLMTQAFGQQQERIIRFHTDIKIETDGRIEVAEHIRLYAAGVDIKRGIVRSIPLYRMNNRGENVRTDYNVLSVQCNGADTKYRTERENNNLEVYIGDADVLLDVGEYDYTVVYESYGHIGFFDDFDELYWNVTGKGWMFSIEQASAAITLPHNANAIQTDFYTGERGSEEKDCTVDDRENIQVFTSTRALAPREELTIAVAFTRDVITRPPPPENAETLSDELAAVGQQERFISYHSDIVIETDGTVIVTEHIKVYATGNRIRRGIIRSIPITREDVKGNRVWIDVNVISATCNGENEKYSTNRSDGECAIRIGKENVLLKPGEYEYVITYSSRGHIGFFKEYDELYWNVTGFNDFFIEQASATLTLPDGVEALETYAYTGGKGVKGQDYAVENRGNVQVFTATRAFAPEEGLTISVTFPTGIIERPASPITLTIIFFLLTVGILAILYFTAQKAKHCVVIPQFSPPNDWSPGVIRYLHRKSYDNNIFAAAILQLAVKGAIVISKKSDVFQLDKTSDVSRLNREELLVHEGLFTEKESIKLKSETSALIKTIKAHQAHIKVEYNIKDYFTKNTKRLVWGLVVIHLLPMLYSGMAKEDFMNAGVVALPFLVLSICACFLNGDKQILAFLSVAAAIISVLLALFGIPFEDGWPEYLAPVPTVYLIATGLFYTSFAFLLYRPTEKGAQAVADIEGLLMYMQTAESHRLNILNPPDQTPEHFEKLLPYAMALGIANQWCSRFASILAAAQYQPSWSSDTFDQRSWGSFNSSFTQPFSTSVSSASTTRSDSSSGSSSWSSGSGGGGSSGGGGGGGRTSGW